MTLNPASLLNPVLNTLDALISDYRIYCYLVFVWPSLRAIGWITMITSHPRQSNCARRARKNEYAGTVNFTTQIAPSIGTVAFTKHDKSDAIIFKSRCSRTPVSYRFMAGQAKPLNFVRFLRLANSSPMIQRSPARRSRNIRQPSQPSPTISANHPASYSAKCLASWPRNVPAKVAQCQRQYAECPSRQLASQLAMSRTWPRNVRTGNLCSNSQDGCSTGKLQSEQHPRHHLASGLRKFRRQLSAMTSKYYEHTTTDARS